MLELKPLHQDAIPAALQKAERYRLLNEPREAESICRDVLAADPDCDEAHAALVLALTDQFPAHHGVTLNHAVEAASHVAAEYQRIYLTGLAYERWAKAQLERGVPGEWVFGWLREALGAYGRAEQLAPKGNDEAVLRWNAIVRLIRSDPQMQNTDDARAHAATGQDLPLDV